MGDDTKPLSSGDRWRPTASGLNELREAADYVADQKRGGGSLANPQIRREFGTVVLVKNEGTPQETWPMWSPVAVVSPPGNLLSNVVRFMARPYFRGCRLDDYSFDQMLNRTVGITQEPIPYGKTGRVCIHGLTPALVWDIEKGQQSAQEYPSRDYIQAEKNGSRWMFRWAPSGDAKVIQYLPPSSSTWYQDGTYNDQFLLLVDLCGPPDRVVRFALQSWTYPAYSIIPGSQYWLHSIPSVTNDSTRGALVPTSEDFYVTPGWTITGATCIPCRRVMIGGIYCVATPYYAPYAGGVACGQLWQGLSGFTLIAEHFLVAGSGRYTAPFSGWYRFNGSADVLRAHFTGGVVYLNDGTYDFDGGTHSGLQYPLCQPELESIGSGTYSGWNLKKLDSTNLYFFGSGISSGYIRPTPRFFDDPVGTIKLWSGSTSTIPAGWRLCDGTNGTIDLRGRFVMGLNTTSGAPGNEASVGQSGGYRYHGYSENQHTKTTVAAGSGASSAIATIDAASGNDTDNRPRFYVLAYIQRTDA